MCNCRRLSLLFKRLNFQKGLVRNFSVNRRASSRTLLHGWGSCDSNELGKHHKTNDIVSPIIINVQEELASLSCGYGTTFLIRRNQNGAIGFGLNTVGQLGIKNDTDEVTLDHVIRKLSCGRAHTLAVSTDGVFAAGSNIQGQCGLDKDHKFCKQFTKVPLPFDHNTIKQIACGLDHSLILTAEGRVFSTGLGADGQTGIGSHDCQYGFVQITGEINKEKIIQISTSTDTCLALTDSSTIYGWGNNEQGQVSWQNDEKQVSLPVKVEIAPGLNEKINHVFAGGSFSAFTTNGGIYVTGYGALGLGKDTIEAHTYQKINHSQEVENISKLSGGPDYMAALTDTGKLLTWGRGNHGRLGHGTTEDQYFPKMVSLHGRVLDFACGVDHMVAIVERGDKVMA